jgi:hypothetical protein
MMRFLFAFMLSLVLVATSACSMLPEIRVSPASLTQAHAVTLLDDIFIAYSSYDVKRFDKFLAFSFKPSRKELMALIQEQKEENRYCRIKYSIDKIQPNLPFPSVFITWEKSSVSDDGRTSYRSGQAECVFQQNFLLWRLYSVRGESPFQSATS